MAYSQHLIKFWGGSLFELLLPAVRRDLATDQHSGRFLRAKRWILYARATRARRRGDTAALQKNLFQYWHADTSDVYFDRYEERFQQWFMGPHHEIVDQLARLAKSGAYTRLVEVGCGSGRVLEHCAAMMPEVPLCIGVDINPSIIDRDRAHYAANPRLQFLAADASEWLAKTAQPGTILLTYGGVMEYFAPETLVAMFRDLAAHGPAAVGLVEPVDPAHDLAHDSASHAFGDEHSFSHNHAQLLRQAGYEIRFSKALTLGLQSWIMLVATAPKPPEQPPASQSTQG